MKMKFSLKSGIWVGLVAALVVGCNNSADTASGSGGINLTREEEAHTLPSGAQIHVVYDETGTVGVPVRLKVRLRAPGSAAGVTKGTVHWGDNSDDRITDDHNVVVRHVYQAAGTYRFAIQIDGDEKMVAGTISVQPAASASAEGEVATPAGPANPANLYVCMPSEGSDIVDGTALGIKLQLPLPPATIITGNIFASCDDQAIADGPFRGRQDELEEVTFYDGITRGGACDVGGTYGIRFVGGGTTAECTWTVQ